MTDTGVEERLAESEAEIERLRGEFAGLRNILIAVLRDTLTAKPDVTIEMLADLEAEIDRLSGLEVIPAKTFRKEGAQRFYRAFISTVRDRIGH